MIEKDRSFIKKEYCSDSSKELWEDYYKPFYSSINWEFWGILDWKNLQKKGERYYVKCDEKNIESKFVSLKRITQGEEVDFNLIKKITLGGEMDFNFIKNDPKKWHKNKYGAYEETIKDDKEMLQEDKDAACQLLEKCQERQCMCCNFSVLIRNGGLNNLKGKMSQDRRALDRFDVFIFVLNDYFVKRNNQRKVGQKEDYMHIIFSESWHNAKENREILCEYLGLYNDIKDYFIRNYRINDEKLIEDLIESGSKPINSGKRVEEYLKLANRYWDAKEVAINEIIGSK